jgi:hypothetical protein
MARRILDSGYRLKMVVGFEFYSPSYTSYLGCLQLVTMAVFSAIYLWLFFSHVVKIGTQSVSYGISYHVDMVRVLLPICIATNLVLLFAQSKLMI